MTVQTSYRVVGMTCEHCVRAVTEEVGRLRGVRAVDVDLDTGALSVTSDTPLDQASVEAAVVEAGYALAGAHT